MAIYLIEAAGLYKIGFSTNVRRRVASLCTASAVPIVLLAAVPGTRRDERLLHEAFAAHHHHGEWFTGNPGILEAFRLLMEARGDESTAPAVGPINDIATRAPRGEPLPVRAIPRVKYGRGWRGKRTYHSLRLYFADGTRREVGGGWWSVDEARRAAGLALLGGIAAVRAMRTARQ